MWGLAMTINELIPGDIILWNNQPVVIEAINIRPPFFTQIKFSSEFVINNIDGGTAILYLGSLTAAQQIIEPPCPIEPGEQKS